MTIPLSFNEFRETFTSKMIDVTATAEPVVDIWPYVEELRNEKLVVPYVFEKQLVEMVNRTEDSSFDHVLLPTPDANVFVVIIVDLIHSKIKGHIELDLNKLYGLSKKST